MELTEKSIEILGASRKLFASKGFSAVTTKEIATVAKVNELTIFRNFKNKENLFRQMLLYYVSKPNVGDFINNEEKYLVKYLFGIGNLIHSIFVENIDLLKIELVERQRMYDMDLANGFPNEIKDRMINYLINKQKHKEHEATIFTVSFMTSIYGLCMNLYFMRTFVPAPMFSETLDFIVSKFS